MLSGVPQGTVLGPCLFLCFINDIVQDIQSNVSLFADDSLIYREMSEPADVAILQDDLLRMEEWSRTWLLRFNVAKCVHLRIHPARCVITSNSSYSLCGENIPTHGKVKYLGITISDTLDTTEHINNVASKANRTLGVIRRNFSKCTQEVRKTLYSTMVRPQMEYATAAWDPHQQTHIDALEKVQNRAVRFIANDYRQTSSVSGLKTAYGLDSLQKRRRNRRLTAFHDYLNGQLAIDNFPALARPPANTRSAVHHLCVFDVPFIPNTNYLRQSYLYRTIREWNQLPATVVNAPSRPTFSMALCRA